MISQRLDASEFVWGSGRIVQWRLNQLDSQVPLAEQSDKLTEDLAQVLFGEHTLVDVGWYPEFSKDGSFVVVTVRNGNWEEPIFKASCRTIEALRDAIRIAILRVTAQPD